MKIVKCERCRRPFGSYAMRCPDCGWRSRYWFRSVSIRLVAVVSASVALTAAWKMAHKQWKIEQALPKATPTPDQLAMPAAEPVMELD